MTPVEWFRNTTWDDGIAAQFESKLKRARDKSQYLRLQAYHLVQTHPTVALTLLNRYFASGTNSFHAAAYNDRATAHLVLGETETAIQSYEDAIRHENAYPSHLTNARIELPYLIAMNEIAHHFDRGIAILEDTDARLLAFPLNRFKRSASLAIILAARGEIGFARREARTAFEAASLDHSGFRRHPKLGLVSDAHASTLSKLQRLCDA